MAIILYSKQKGVKKMVLYHYCPTETFFKILESKEIWFSDVTKSNDSSEIKYTMDILKEYLLKKRESLYRKLYYSEVEKTLSHYKFFCWCLSEEGDKLSQWRAYAPSGGVSLGFDFAKLETYISSLSYIPKECRPREIKYKKRDFINEVLKTIDFSHPYDEEIQTLLDNIPFYKNKSFGEEKEWRIGFREDLKEQYSPVDKSESQTSKDDKFSIRYRKCENGDSIVFYYAFPFPIEALTEIVIGPKCNLNEYDIMTLLDLSFPNCHIDPSVFSVTIQSIYKSRIPLQ